MTNIDRIRAVLARLQKNTIPDAETDQEDIDRDWAAVYAGLDRLVASTKILTAKGSALAAAVMHTQHKIPLAELTQLVDAATPEGEQLVKLIEVVGARYGDGT